MKWAEFESAAPQLAALGRERFAATGVALLGTLRRDGSPRISPIEPYVVMGHLLFGVMRSAKGSDLERDPRCVIHSSVSNANGSEGEFNLSGHALLVSDVALREADHEAWWKSFPPDASSVYSLDIASATFVSWDFDSMTYEVSRWPVEGEVITTRSKYP